MVEVSNMEKKWNKEIDIMKNSQVGKFQRKTSVNQIKPSVDSIIISRQDQTEDKNVRYRRQS
jgi:hypothetical protein